MWYDVLYVHFRLPVRCVRVHTYCNKCNSKPRSLSRGKTSLSSCAIATKITEPAPCVLERPAILHRRCCAVCLWGASLVQVVASCWGAHEEDLLTASLSRLYKCKPRRRRTAFQAHWSSWNIQMRLREVHRSFMWLCLKVFGRASTLTHWPSYPVRGRGRGRTRVSKLATILKSRRASGTAG